MSVFDDRIEGRRCPCGRHIMLVFNFHDRRLTQLWQNDTYHCTPLRPCHRHAASTTAGTTCTASSDLWARFERQTSPLQPSTGNIDFDCEGASTGGTCRNKFPTSNAREVRPDHLQLHTRQISSVNTHELPWPQSAEEICSTELHVNVHPNWAQKVEITEHQQTTHGLFCSIVSEPTNGGPCSPNVGLHAGATS